MEKVSLNIVSFIVGYIIYSIACILLLIKPELFLVHPISGILSIGILIALIISFITAIVPLVQKKINLSLFRNINLVSLFLIVGLIISYMFEVVEYPRFIRFEAFFSFLLHFFIFLLIIPISAIYYYWDCKTVDARMHKWEETRKKKEKEKLEWKRIKEEERLDKATRPLKVEESKIVRLLEKLDQKYSDGEIDEDYYRELKDKYEKELDRTKKELVQKELLAEVGLEDMPPMIEDGKVEYHPDGKMPLEKEEKPKPIKNGNLAVNIIAWVLATFLIIFIVFVDFATCPMCHGFGFCNYCGWDGEVTILQYLFWFFFH